MTKRSIDQLAVDLAGQRGLGEAGADRRRNLGDRRRLFERTNRSVGKCYVDHVWESRLQKQKSAGQPHFFAETTRLRLADRRDCDTSSRCHNARFRIRRCRPRLWHGPSVFEMLVGAIGFEPTTPTMSRWCSNQLSYAPGNGGFYPFRPDGSNESWSCVDTRTPHCPHRRPANQRRTACATPGTARIMASTRSSWPRSGISTVNNMRAEAARLVVLVAVTLMCSRDRISVMSRKSAGTVAGLDHDIDRKGRQRRMSPTPPRSGVRRSSAPG